MIKRTNQELFDIAVKGLASQGFTQSFDPDRKAGLGECVYRGEGGRKCAIGWAIPDDKYGNYMEGNRAEAFRAAGVDFAGKPYGQFSFAVKLQLAHDLSESPEGMRYRLLKFGKENGLVIPEVLL